MATGDQQKSANHVCSEPMSFFLPPVEALSGSLSDYEWKTGPDLLGRIKGFTAWQDQRRRYNLWPYSRSIKEAPGPICTVNEVTGRSKRGINFASQDYLSLSSHFLVKEAAKEIIEKYGVHSAGSSALLGNTFFSVELEKAISNFLKMEETLLFPTGWAAGYGAIRGLIGPSDHVVLDIFAHNCLQEGARAATSNVRFHKHLDLGSLRRQLARIRKHDEEDAILVVTESLFSMDSDTPNIRAIKELCSEFRAFLLVDVAHDLGNIGRDGTGFLGKQGMLGKVDIVMGSFSKTFASNGGFVSCNSRHVKEYLQYYSSSCTFSNALSPVQAATVLKALEIVQSTEGESLRTELMQNVLYLRDELRRLGLDVLGEPSAIVAVKVGNEAFARILGERLFGLGGIVNLVEYPAVSKGGARFRLQVMSKHSRADIDSLITYLEQSLLEVDILCRYNKTVYVL